MRKPVRVPLEQLSPHLVETPLVPEKFAWPAVFGNDHPVEVEVGFGKGLFLLRAGQANPEVNFLGIEVMRKNQLYTATRLEKRNIQNVRLLKADAQIAFRDHVEAESLQAVHVYFPDPWWKKRHHKRRVFTAEFAAECERVLRPGGMLHAATDVGDYFTVIAELLTHCPRLKSLPPPDVNAPQHDLDYLTNFERKFRKQGKPIWRGVWEKV